MFKKTSFQVRSAPEIWSKYTTVHIIVKIKKYFFTTPGRSSGGRRTPKKPPRSKSEDDEEEASELESSGEFK